MSQFDDFETHEYDGIQEENHPLPRWWVWSFYAPIVFGFFYVLHYMVLDGPTLNEEWAANLRAHEAVVAQARAAAPAINDDAILALVKDPSRLSQGKTAFVAKCASCHGEQGQGGIGPNLTDAYWIHGGKPSQVALTIRDGVADKGMPPWGPMLASGELESISAFIRTMSGTKPAGAKPPQGNLVKD